MFALCAAPLVAGLLAGFSGGSGVVIPAATAAAAPVAALAPPPPAPRLTRYSLAGGCYRLRSTQTGAELAPAAAPLRVRATALGEYLLYGVHGEFVSDLASASVADAPSASTVWRARRPAVHAHQHRHRRLAARRVHPGDRLRRVPGGGGRCDRQAVHGQLADRHGAGHS
jgi:hypothetical protein